MKYQPGHCGSVYLQQGLVMRTVNAILCVFIWFALVVGCDKTRTVQQSAKLKITPIDESSIASLFTLREKVAMSPLDQEREEFSPGRFDLLYPKYGPEPIDKNGEIEFSVEITEITDTSDSIPPAWMLPLGSNKTFEIESADGVSRDRIELTLTPGTIVSSRTLKVEVISVSTGRFK